MSGSSFLEIKVDTMIFHLAHKQTDGLAEDLCLLNFTLPPISGQNPTWKPTTGYG